MWKLIILLFSCLFEACLSCETAIMSSRTQITANLLRAKPLDSINDKPDYARLNNDKAFCANVDKDFYLQVDFNEIMTITKLKIQGFNNLLLDAFVLHFSVDGKRWFVYNTNRDHIHYFLVLFDGHQQLDHLLQPPAISRYMRILPSWRAKQTTGDICIRFQAYGCTQFRPPVLKTDTSIITRIGERSDIQCQADGMGDLSVGWESLDTKVTTTLNNKLLHHTLTSKKSLNISFQDLHLYTCVSSMKFLHCTKNSTCTSAYMFSNKSEVTSDTTVTVKIRLPGQPGHFVVSQKKKETVLLTWKFRKNNDYPLKMLQFALTCNISGEMITEMLPITVLSKRFIGLKVYTAYQCSLKIQLRSASIKTTKKPFDVSTTKTSLLININTARDTILNNVNTTESINSWNTTNKPTVDMRSSQRYNNVNTSIYNSVPSSNINRSTYNSVPSSNIQLKSTSNYSFNQTPVVLNFRSMSTRPNILPIIRYYAVSATIINVSMKANFMESSYGQLKGYRIQINLIRYGGRKDPQLLKIGNLTSLRFVPAVTSVEISRMKPWSMYNISISAFNKDMLFSNVSFQKVHTQQGRPTGSPTIQKLTAGQDYITVNVVSFPRKYWNGEITYYQLFMKPYNRSEIIRNNKDVMERNIFQLLELQPNVLYKFRCRAKTKVGYGPYGDEISVRTEEGLPNAPTDISILSVKDKPHLFLRWIKPSKPNGNITKYEIEVILKNRTKLTRFASSHELGLHEIKVPSKKVSKVAIRAYTSKGFGEWSIHVSANLVTTYPPQQDGNNTLVIITTFSIAFVILICLVIVGFFYCRRQYPPQLYHVQAKDAVQMEPMLNMQLASTSNPEEDLQEPEPTPQENHDHIPVEAFSAYVNKVKKHGYQELKEQFKNQLMTGKCFPCNIAERPENKYKNRYLNILAYDHSRVVLKHDNQYRSSSDYINANFVHGYNQTLPHKYICTQGPLENTADDFWWMVWQEEISIIVMIANLKEDDKVKCYKYWPSEGTVKYGCINVKIEKIDKTADYMTRSFIVEKVNSKEQRTINQFHFISWPDHGVPDYPTSLLSLRRRVKHYNEGDKPILVHCSAGIGRTGAFILIDTMLERIDNEQNVDLFNHLQYMRQRRINMVQTDKQFVFVHQAILEYITFGNTEILVDELDKKTRELTRGTGMEEEFGLITRNTQSTPMVDNLYQVLLCEGNFFDAYYVDGYKQRDAFIITLAPTEKNVADFWKMVLETQCHTIVMLNKSNEPSQDYFKYWPDVDGYSHYRDVAVLLNSEVANGNIITRRVKVTTNKKKCEVHHFQYVDWPNADVPYRRDYSNICTLMQAVEKSQQNLGNGPIIVHAGNDYGRSGTFIAIYNSTERLKVEQLIDVLQCVRAIRISQPLSVDNMTQYQFVYNMLRTYLEGFNYANYGYRVCRSPPNSTS